VLHTGVLFRAEALERLARLPSDVIVPAVVFTERARQLAKRGITPDDFRERLAANEFAIEAYGEEQATRWAPGIHDDEDWHRLARDAMIAGHLDRGSILWTTDPTDVRELGLPGERIVAV
jgi:predicted nucleic acid-binding protein